MPVASLLIFFSVAMITGCARPINARPPLTGCISSASVDSQTGSVVALSADLTNNKVQPLALDFFVEDLTTGRFGYWAASGTSSIQGGTRIRLRLWPLGPAFRPVIGDTIRLSAISRSDGQTYPMCTYTVRMTAHGIINPGFTNWIQPADGSPAAPAGWQLHYSSDLRPSDIDVTSAHIANRDALMLGFHATKPGLQAWEWVEMTQSVPWPRHYKLSVYQFAACDIVSPHPTGLRGVALRDFLGNSIIFCVTPTGRSPKPAMIEHVFGQTHELAVLISGSLHTWVPITIDPTQYLPYLRLQPDPHGDVQLVLQCAIYLSGSAPRLCSVAYSQ